MKKIRFWSIFRLGGFEPEERFLLIISFVYLSVFATLTVSYFYDHQKLEKEHLREKEKIEREYQEAKEGLHKGKKSTLSSRPCGFSNYYDMTETGLVDEPR